MNTHFSYFQVIKILFIIPLFLSVQLLFAQEQIVQGRLLSSEEESALSFATVHIENTSVGTVTNTDGEFSIIIPAAHKSGSLVFSYVGYNSKIISLEQLQTEANLIRLAPHIVELETVVVYPLSPEDYIAKVMRNLKDKYIQSFEGEAYFRRKTEENGTVFQMAQGYILAQSDNFSDDMSPLYQRLLLFEDIDNIGDINFGKTQKTKSVEKAKNKAEKRGEDVEEAATQAETVNSLTIGMATPAELLRNDPFREVALFLDSTQFKFFRYTYEADAVYQGKEVIVIAFESKRKRKAKGSNMKSDWRGKLYFDKDADMPVGVDYKTKSKVPLYLRPLLLMGGIRLSNPELAQRIRYNNHNDKWYPQNIKTKLQMELEKKSGSNSNGASDIRIELLLALSNVTSKRTAAIPREYQLVDEVPLEQQIYPIEGIDWNGVNQVKLGELP